MRLSLGPLARRAGWCSVALFTLTLASAQAPVPPAASAASTPRARISAPKTPSLSSNREWSELTPDQQRALQPLAASWSGISAGQKRKWIAMAHNYPTLSEAERSTLHGRMNEWVAMSSAQRYQARQNFAQTKGLTAEQKKAQWEAYQALSPEQKKQFAADAQPKGVGAARAVTPVAPNKLAAVPITRSDGGDGSAVTKPSAVRVPAVPRPAVAPAVPASSP